MYIKKENFFVVIDNYNSRSDEEIQFKYVHYPNFDKREHEYESTKPNNFAFTTLKKKRLKRKAHKILNVEKT